MNGNYQDKLTRAKKAIKGADAVLIGGGAGLSAAAGLVYGGERFYSNFKEFIGQYGMMDMYSAGFYPFKTQEEKWAYWSRHIKLNRFDPEAGEVYLKLFELVKDKDYFVITTNVDAQFYKAGFDPEKVFAVQGDYGKLQCAGGCHNKLYDNETLVRQMVSGQKKCRIPSHLVPHCPECNGLMDINLRKDYAFVQDEEWYQSSRRYTAFISRIMNRKLSLLELGVGYNTPTIIRFPFEEITAQTPNATLIRINKDYPEAGKINLRKTIAFENDIAEIMAVL
ncbi:MAG: Sir2 family NAD-dependent protein deacetylase [Desulfobacula sp.]|jgi:NAD-dependent SIR2 family protein deacetylase